MKQKIYPLFLLLMTAMVCNSFAQISISQTYLNQIDEQKVSEQLKITDQSSTVSRSAKTKKQEFFNIKSDKAITGSIICIDSLYQPGTTMNMTLHLSVYSPDWEYGNGFYLVFPPGFTINSADAVPISSGGYASPAIFADSVAWSTTFYYSSSAGGPLYEFDFDVNVSIASFVSGTQTGSYYVWGDGYGSAPHNFSGTFNMHSAVQPPANDSCHNAITISCGDTIAGTTLNATLDANVTDCYTIYNTPGVWYSFMGNGQYVKADVCSFFSYDTKLFVFTGTCNNFTCVTGNDDYCGLGSGVEFMTNPGTEYFILVGGYGGGQGNFELALNCNDTCLMSPIVDIQSTMTDVTILLSGVGSITDFDIELQFENVPFTGTPTNSNMSIPIYIDNLTQDSYYHFMIRGECSPGVFSSWIGPFRFNTFCLNYDYTSLDYSEGYVSYSSGTNAIQIAEDFYIPASECWEVTDFTVHYFTTNLDTIEFAFYSNSALNLPENLIFTDYSVNFDSTYTGNYFGYNTYEITVTLDTPLEFCGGTTGQYFWLSTWIKNPGGNCYWECFPGIIGLEPTVKDGLAYTSCSDWGVAHLCFVSNLVTYSMAIGLQDIMSPEFDLCPTDMIVYVESSSGTTVTYTEPVAYDNCSVDVVQTAGLPSGSNFPVGVTVNTFIADDDSGNLDTCEFTVTVVDITAIEELNGDFFAIYPNPSDGYLSITFSANTTYQLSIYTPEGSLVYTRSVNSPLSEDMLNVQHLNKGIYYVNVIIGNQTFMKKLMIQ